MTDWKFCEASDILALTRIADGFAKYDGIVQRLLPLVAIQIQNFCRRTFIQNQYVEYFSTPHMERRPFTIWLNELNMQSTPTPPVVKLDFFYPLDWSLITPLDPMFYRVDYGLTPSSNPKIVILRDLTQNNEAIQVTYNAGFPPDSNDSTLVDVPDPIVQAAALQGAFLLGMIVNKDMGQKVKNAQGTHKTLALDTASREGLIPEAQALIMPFRRQLVGKYY